jgi:hypothetical protein
MVHLTHDINILSEKQLVNIIYEFYYVYNNHISQYIKIIIKYELTKIKYYKYYK